MRHLIFMLALTCAIAMFASCAAAQDSQPADAAVVDHSDFDAILRDNVRDERIDYLNIRDHHLPALDGYLTELAAMDPALLDDNERLAMFINLYNATVIREVIRRYKPGYTVAADDYAIFKAATVHLDGNMISLDHLEHQMIRKAFDEPRIHVALVCGAVSCPPLLTRAYTGATLAATLDANMRRFITDGSRNRVDADAKRLHLSPIFNWFADDFGGSGQIADYVDTYTEADVSTFTVTYLEYDWSLNIAPASESETGAESQ